MKGVTESLIIGYWSSFNDVAWSNTEQNWLFRAQVDRIVGGDYLEILEHHPKGMSTTENLLDRLNYWRDALHKVEGHPIGEGKNRYGREPRRQARP